MSDRRAVITGVGLVTALGPDRETTWQGLLRGDCGFAPVTLFDVASYRSRIAAEVDLERAASALTPLQRRRWSRSDQIGLVASAEALQDSGILDVVDRTRVGVMFGAGTADLLRNERFLFTYLEHGIDRTRLSDIWQHFPNTPVDVVASHFGLEGARSCVVAACSSSTIALGHALSAIRQGRVDAVVAGGTDALARLTFSGFNALRLMDPDPCRPFDRRRSGMNIGEGAGIFILEEMEHARRRGAHIYGELAGYSLACEAFHPTAPEPDGRTVGRIIREALADAREPAGDVGHVNAHATATPQNDKAEAAGIRAALGARAGAVPVTSLKSMLGHCLGAAGGIEAAVMALTVARGVIPPTIHYEEPDPDVDLDVVTEARETPVRCAVSTSLAFGGNDSAVVIRRV
jgi:3-oxoacyl-[acyl-carrier-protein] synthase II